jgi:hypothetical protein
VPDKLLSQITPADIEVARARLEDLLIELRDMRASIEPGPRYGHGLVVKEHDGEPSSMIRITTREAVALALKTILEAPDE